MTCVFTHMYVCIHAHVRVYSHTCTCVFTHIVHGRMEACWLLLERTKACTYGSRRQENHGRLVLCCLCVCSYGCRFVFLVYVLFVCSVNRLRPNACTYIIPTCIHFRVHIKYVCVCVRVFMCKKKQFWPCPRRCAGSPICIYIHIHV